MSEQTFKPAAIAALRTFKELRTSGHGNEQRRLEGLQALVDTLVDVYEIPAVIRVVVRFFPNTPYQTDDGVRIFQIVADNLSIITVLHKFAAVRAEVTEFREGLTFEGRQYWAAGLFKKVYPKQFDKLVVDLETGHLVRRESLLNSDNLPSC